MRAKLFGIGFGIAVLFPIAAHFLVFLLSPPPKREDFGLDSPYSSYVEAEAGTKEERRAAAAEHDRKFKLFESAEKRHKAHVFYGVYPMGLLAIVLGALSRLAASGAGLIFGGIFALGDGCFSSWDIVPGWVTIAAVLFAFVVVMAVGIRAERLVSASPPA